MWTTGVRSVFGRVLRSTSFITSRRIIGASNSLRPLPLSLLGTGLSVTAGVAASSLALAFIDQDNLFVESEAAAHSGLHQIRGNNINVAPDELDEVVEPYTGHRFRRQRSVWIIQPWVCDVQTHEEIAPECRQEDVQLIGVGIRCMLDNCTLPFLRAYSVGIYASMDGVRSQLQTGNKALAEVLGTPGFTKSLRLVMNKGVSSSHIGDGLRRSISKHIVHEDDRPKLEQVVKGICSHQKRLKADDELLLTCCGNGDIVLEIQDHVVVVVPSSMTLAQAIFDAYVGDKPVSNRAKNSFLTSWNNLVSRSA